MPFLYQGKLIGRVAVKADRKAKRLVVQGIWYEDGWKSPDVEPVLQRTLGELERWVLSSSSLS